MERLSENIILPPYCVNLILFSLLTELQCNPSPTLSKNSEFWLDKKEVKILSEYLIPDYACDFNNFSFTLKNNHLYLGDFLHGVQTSLSDYVQKNINSDSASQYNNALAKLSEFSEISPVKKSILDLIWNDGSPAKPPTVSLFKSFQVIYSDCIVK